MADFPEDWERKCSWMRAQGVTSANWDEGGTLLSCSLGAPPPPVGEELPAAPGPQVDRRRIALGATSRGVIRAERRD